MNFKVKFSVIIPTYNRADLLPALLNSLVLQTFSDFEIIICDDGSVDNTSEIVNEYKDKIDIKYILLENNGGPAAPRNAGIRAAEGEYCAFLDSDDEWYVDKLTEVSKVLEKGFDWTYHDLDIKKNNEITGVVKARDYNKKNAMESLLVNFNPVPTSSVVVRTEVLKQVGFFRTEKSFHFVEDFDYWLRLVKVNTNSFAIKKSLGIYNDHEVNNSKSKLQIEKLGDIYDLYNEKLKSKDVTLAKYYAQFSLAYNSSDNNLCKQICGQMIKLKFFHLYTFKALIKCMKIK